MKKASIHFEQVHNIAFEASHLGRTELHEPKYLLPIEHRLPNFTIEGSMSFDQVEKHFHAAKARMTGQAKARGSSPLWDGVMVLPDVGDPSHFEAVARKRLANWALAYQKLTGQRVLNISVHQDEGYINDEGLPVYNKHAHVLIDRLGADGRVIKLERAQLGKVQDMTAEVMGMQRGSTLKEREGRRGRPHVPHRQYRAQAEAQRLARIDLERSELQNYALSGQLDQEREFNADLAQEALGTDHDELSIRDMYHAIRGAFVAHHGALQIQHMAVKKLYEGGNEIAIKALHGKLHDRAALHFELESCTGIDFFQLDQEKKLGESKPDTGDGYTPG